jgi:hypothetical protein
MSEFDMVARASLEVYPAVAATLTEAGEGWFGPDMTAQVARRAIAAWAAAVNGDDAPLAAMADGDAAHWLLNPVRKAWAIAPGPVVTGITIWAIDRLADPAELSVSWRFTGCQRPVEPTPEPGLALPTGWSDEQQVFVGMITLAFTGPLAWPWRLTSGHVSTLDDHLGYRFVSRLETVAQYQRRTGAGTGAEAGVGVGDLAPTDAYLLDAAFAEHDERLGSSAQLEVSSDPAPTRAEAEKLIWPAIWAECERALGPGEWRPSLGTLTMIRLLGPAADHP